MPLFFAVNAAGAARIMCSKVAGVALFVIISLRGRCGAIIHKCREFCALHLIRKLRVSSCWF